MSEALTEKQETLVVLLLNWRRRAIRASNGHYMSSSHCKFWSNLLTCFNIASAIAVLFFSNNKFFDNGNAGEGATLSFLGNSNLYTAIAGLLVVLTTALQYVLKLELKTRDAKSAGNDFTNIKRDIELALAEDTVSLEKARSIQISHTHSSRNHELVSRRAWKAANEQTEKAFLEDNEFEKAVRTKFGLSADVELDFG